MISFWGISGWARGFRLHPRLQTVFALTLPTNTGPPGYGREVVSANLLNTLSLPLTSRLLLEAGLSGGYTPGDGIPAGAAAGALRFGKHRAEMAVLGTPVAVREPVRTHSLLSRYRRDRPRPA